MHCLTNWYNNATSLGRSNISQISQSLSRRRTRGYVEIRLSIVFQYGNTVVNPRIVQNCSITRQRGIQSCYSYTRKNYLAIWNISFIRRQWSSEPYIVTRKSCIARLVTKEVSMMSICMERHNNDFDSHAYDTRKIYESLPSLSFRVTQLMCVDLDFLLTPKSEGTVRLVIAEFQILQWYTSTYFMFYELSIISIITYVSR